MKRSILACLAGLLTWFVVVTVINRELRLSLPNYTAAEHTLQFTLGMKWARLLMAIVTSLVAGAVTRCVSPSGRRAPLIVGSVVLAMSHGQLEQISRVVSPDISPDDYSGGARGCAAATAPEQGPQRGLLRTEIKFHRRVSRIEPATAAS
jgi:hypothetical protein